MNAASEISIRSLQETAALSEEREAFTVLAKMRGCRIGAGARLESLAEPTFFVEVLVNLSTSHDAVNLDHVERELTLLRWLQQNGYVLNCEEDGCITCELIVQSKELSGELKKTHAMIERIMGATLIA